MKMKQPENLHWMCKSQKLDSKNQVINLKSLNDVWLLRDFLCKTYLKNNFCHFKEREIRMENIVSKTDLKRSFA